ncbi:hypothetical protein, partial [uncultured Gammaproteobacteria bacterium]
VQNNLYPASEDLPPHRWLRKFSACGFFYVYNLPPHRWLRKL